MLKFPKDLCETVAEFRRRVTPSSSTLVLTHDYPDPDCLASAFGISQLLSFWGTQSTVISFGGFVGRAENKAMVRFLNLHTVPSMLLDFKDFDRIVLVDCVPGRSNVSLPAGTCVHAVIDHHGGDAPAHQPFFADIRKDVGAASTIVTEYLLKVHCPINSKLATALYYGIKTDTGDLGRDSTAEDQECYKYLFGHLNHGLLSKIENPDRDVTYFKILQRAAQAMVAFGSIGYIPLGFVSSPDYVAEMADLFHSLEKIDITVCSGFFKKDIFFSVRSKNRDEAGLLAQKIASAQGGGGGGHGRLGAGRVPCHKSKEGELMDRFFETVKTTFAIEAMEGEKILEEHKRK
jgi:nanoRNase/pAp phosphatase (c-di-AMP/oligoRNAs hydrolase)